MPHFTLAHFTSLAEARRVRDELQPAFDAHPVEFDQPPQPTAEERD